MLSVRWAGALPSVLDLALSKAVFAKCHRSDTRQMIFLFFIYFSLFMEGHVTRCLPSAIICRVFFPYLPSAGVCRVFFSIIAECKNVCRVFSSKTLGKQRVCRVSESLLSVFSLALGKEMVCRVSDKIHSAKNMTQNLRFR